jgi:hypothetical protein
MVSRILQLREEEKYIASGKEAVSAVTNSIILQSSLTLDTETDGRA